MAVLWAESSTGKSGLFSQQVLDARRFRRLNAGKIELMGVRLIALDIDGTLLDSRWKLPEANRAAICEAARRGIEVALATGRRYDFALPVARGSFPILPPV